MTTPILPDASSSPPCPLTHPNYRADIDGLRAVAVLAVVGFHAFPDYLTGGFIGVDIFFVISGYLISTILFQNLQQGSFSFRTFYSRRIKRIFPALLLVLATVLLCGWALLFEDEYQQLWRHATAGSAFIANLLLWREDGYFAPAADVNPLLHLWSLGVEEQFYIAWPFLVYAGWKLRANLLVLTSLIGVASFSLNLLGRRTDPLGMFYSPQTRFWELLIGAGLAYATLWIPAFKSTTTRRLDNALALAGAVLILGGTAFFSKQLVFPGWWALIPTVGAASLIAAGPSASVNRTLLSGRTLVWIGLISYPLYLWHWPLLSFARIVEGATPAMATRAFAVLLAILLSWLTVVLLERPVRRSLAGTTTGILVALAIGLALIGSRAFSDADLPSRLGGRASASLIDQEAFARSRSSDTSCYERLNLQPIAEEVCLANSSTPRVLFIGDSHAMALYSSIHAGQIALPSVLISAHSCEFYPALEYTPAKARAWGNNCVALARKAVELATGLPSVRAVVVANITPSLSSTRMSPFRSEGIVLAEREAFVRGTGELVEQMTKAGKKVFYVKDVPYFSQSPQDCRKRIAYVTPPACRIDRSEFDRSRDDYNNAVGDIALRHPSLEVVDATALFCDSAYCSSQDDEAFLYADRHHLSAYGSAKLFEAFLGARLDPGPR